jgi:DNA-binding transcriptional LysR family regulator
MSTTAFPPDVSRLLAFIRVVEAGSFAEAARRAGTTTSAMSKAVARLEQARGTRLLHRSTHSLALTEEGERLMSAGRALAESLARVDPALGEAARDDGGRVRVTAPPPLRAPASCRDCPRSCGSARKSRSRSNSATRFSISRRKASTSQSAQDPSTARLAIWRVGFASPPGSLAPRPPI